MNDVKEPPEEWSVYMSAQNLPAVLNDPNRGKQANIFTKKWGDHFVEKIPIKSTHLLPEITFDHLDSYIKQICKRYRRHVRLNQNIQSREFAAEFSPSKNKTPRPSTSSTISDFNESNKLINSNHVSSSSHNARSNAYDLSDASLDDIPQIFTKSNLDFTNLETFETVFTDISDDGSQKSGRLLQEKLSHYLDVVEVLIAQQVCIRNRLCIWINVNFLISFFILFNFTYRYRRNHRRFFMQ